MHFLNRHLGVIALFVLFAGCTQKVTQKYSGWDSSSQAKNGTTPLSEEGRVPSTSDLGLLYFPVKPIGSAEHGYEPEEGFLVEIGVAGQKDSEFGVVFGIAGNSAYESSDIQYISGYTGYAVGFYSKWLFKTDGPVIPFFKTTALAHYNEYLFDGWPMNIDATAGVLYAFTPRVSAEIQVGLFSFGFGPSKFDYDNSFVNPSGNALGDFGFEARPEVGLGLRFSF